MTRKTWIWLAAVALVVVAGVVTTVLLVSGSDDEADRSADQLGDCTADTRQLLVTFMTSGTTADAKMTKAAPKLRDDPDVEATKTETQQQNFDAYKKAFADQPVLVKLARIEAMPATIWVLPADGVELTVLADRLRGELTDADDVDTEPCDDPPGVATTPATR